MLVRGLSSKLGYDVRNLSVVLVALILHYTTSAGRGERP